MQHAEESSVLFSLRELMTLEERRVQEEEAARQRREQRAAEEARRVRVEDHARAHALAAEARARADAFRAEEVARGVVMRESAVLEARREALAVFEERSLGVRREHEQALARLRQAARQKQRAVLSAAAATLLATTGALLVAGWLRLRSETVAAEATEARAAEEATRRATELRSVTDALDSTRRELARLQAQMEKPAPGVTAAPAANSPAPVPPPRHPPPSPTHPQSPALRPCAHEGDPLCTALP